MKKKAIIAIVLVTFLFISGAVSLAFGASLPKEVSVQLTAEEFMANQHIVKAIELPDGGVLTVALGSNPATGFSWPGEAGIKNAAVLQQIDNKLLVPEAKSIIGYPGSHVWIFRALQNGTTTISFEYSQPWEGGQTAEWTFELIVTVR
jgi:inhibitor of cysteine peptidase